MNLIKHFFLNKFDYKDGVSILNNNDKYVQNFGKQWRDYQYVQIDSKNNFKHEFKAWTEQNNIDALLFTTMRISKVRARLLATLAVKDVKIEPANDLNKIVGGLIQGPSGQKARYMNAAKLKARIKAAKEAQESAVLEAISLESASDDLSLNSEQKYAKLLRPPPLPTHPV